MWDKFVFLTTLAAATCTLRASVGDILRTVAGGQFIDGLFDECLSVAAACGHRRSVRRRRPLTANSSPSRGRG